MPYLLIYQNPKKSKNKVKLHRALYGFLDYSNHGKYKYKREGVVDKKGVRKISRNSLLISELMIDEVKNLISKVGGCLLIKKIK
jgi:hypothetical protein